MEKERVRLQDQIHNLERQIEDLKDQNVQLQYKIEYASDPMLLERLQDATDMRYGANTGSATHCGIYSPLCLIASGTPAQRCVD
jgi:hypothetical protein